MLTVRQRRPATDRRGRPRARASPCYELRGKDADLEALFFELTEAPENTNRNLAQVRG